MAKELWEKRSPDRMPDDEWSAILSRVRSEFEEMPGMRLTSSQARALLGLSVPAAEWVLDRLAEEGFLARTRQGEYVRRSGAP